MVCCRWGMHGGCSQKLMCEGEGERQGMTFVA